MTGSRPPAAGVVASVTATVAPSQMDCGFLEVLVKCPEHPGCLGEILLEISQEKLLLQAVGYTERSDSSHAGIQSDQSPIA